jgi:phi13 family phage major tail protein
MPKPNIVDGIKKVYIATCTDDVSGATFGTPVYCPGVQELGLKLKFNPAPLWAENQMWDNNIVFESAEVSVSLASLTSAQRALIFGQTLASGGGVYSQATDVQPWVAILYKASIPGGAFRYGVIYKGLFTSPDEDIKGQEGKITYAIPKLTGTFIPLLYNCTWEYHIDTTDPSCPVGIDATWFTSVIFPSADIVAPTIASSVPTTAASGVAVTTTYAWTFSEPIIPGCVVPANFFLIKDSDNSIVAGTLSQNVAGTIITFTPTANLAGSSAVYFAVATVGVKDLAGNALVANAVRKFTTL